MFAKLAFKSLVDRKGSVLLTVLAMTVSVFVLLGVEQIRYQAKESFAKSVSGVDLIVGAKTGSLNLLLYSVFRMGSPTNNISWQAYQEVASNPLVDWAVPMMLGDSHQGYRVLGTTPEYFSQFSYGNKHKLSFAHGQAFNQLFDVVLGAEVAKKLQYKLGDKLVLAHGVARNSFSLHKDKPFQVVGILAPTGTPVDQTLHVSLAGIEAIHANWQQNRRSGVNQDPKAITAFMLGLKSRMATFRVQRAINTYKKEPLLAILPGVALSELWRMMSVLENTLRLVSVLILFAAILGLSAMLLASIRERKQEIYLLRVMGARPWFLFVLIELEALLITLLSVLLGIVSLYLTLIFASDYLATEFGLFIQIQALSTNAWYLIASILVAAVIVSAIPSLQAYKRARKG
ncbi:peptide ABC transporter permease [Saccharobesus litoralis]|uniref:Peptide ABC transporter permease n=1 Tax=Saccharobesus litoralis TaxID=2172099 RepID=A0A2S0VMW8_9ALTE|nr:ABC transporter permease [Saccharobesus litoralis]AWB65571.1 peptide ABC transporter permease [Saccharobesus litoralis]